jgi:hypothetical protein
MTAGSDRGRFPGQDAMGQRSRWDPATRALIERRIQTTGRAHFFHGRERDVARHLLDRLVGQPDDARPYIDILGAVDARLLADETDGWHYDTMPSDREAWHTSVRGLDDDALIGSGSGFAECGARMQRELIEAVRTWPSGQRWHGMPPAAVWSLWTRYAMTAFYAHPSAWDEIGFPGPAYPRGYKNLGIGRREPFEVADARPAPRRPEGRQ